MIIFCIPQIGIFYTCIFFEKKSRTKCPTKNYQPRTEISPFRFLLKILP